MLSLRLLGPEDAAVLDHIAPGVFDHALSPRWTAEFLADPRHHMVVAIANGVVLGMASAVTYVHPDKPTELWINEIGVATAHQRQGIGKQLLDALLTHGRKMGCTEAWLLTEKENTAARHLYGTAGGKDQEMIYVTFNIGAESKAH